MVTSIANSGPSSRLTLQLQYGRPGPAKKPDCTASNHQTSLLPTAMLDSVAGVVSCGAGRFTVAEGGRGRPMVCVASIVSSIVEIRRGIQVVAVQA